MLTRDQALELLQKYNKEQFHLEHGETLGKTMRYFANELGSSRSGRIVIS